jgi:spermidine synthase
MSVKTDKQLTVFFIIFTLSGFSGLIYESIWSHYLKLFLGHAAYAQTLVLAIFMGGLTIGSWLCSRYSVRWKNLLIGYAVAEGVIGLFAMVFHNAFDQAVQISYTGIIPSLNQATFINTYKWALSSLMILPQSILLGMTFPLMSSGIIRLSPQNPGRTISLLYFTNSIGAAIGVLVSGFILIRLIGLPWTMRTAGLINIVLALFVWLLMRGQAAEIPVIETEKDGPQEYSDKRWYRFLLFASLVTGSASFIYEIGWIRMLNLVLGSSTHAFELMLSAFIFGLALGALWIQRRIDRISAPVRFLAGVQIAMGLLALFTLLLYGSTFEVMERILKTVSRTDTGYIILNLSMSAIALAVMLPATFCAGMTLPLITFILIKKGHGERSIGAVYAVNTIGAIIGVFFAIHFGMPVLGLNRLITVGAALDITLGLALMWGAAIYISKRVPAVVTALCICAIASVLFLVRFDSYKMASGVYRTGQLLTAKDSELIFHRDGKTATVSLFKYRNGDITVSTNGKVDAGINMSPLPHAKPFPDEPTMVLLGAIPMALHPQATEVATIGFGSGLTTHTLLSNPLIERVDTVEIEKYMIEASNNFRPRVELAYSDPRSRIYIDDAKTFFAGHHKKYDIIISEPSNPWVSGVAGLFSEEFYGQINNYLKKDGLFVQWVQLYEIDSKLVISVLKAIASSYSDYVVYAATEVDMLIIAKKTGVIFKPDHNIFEIPDIAGALKRIKVEGMQDLDIRKIGSKQFLGELLAAFPVKANSDYYPVLDQNAARTRFLRANAQDLLDISHLLLPTLDLMTKTAPSQEVTNVTPSEVFYPSKFAYASKALHDHCMSGRFDQPDEIIPSEIRANILKFRETFCDCRSGPDQIERFFSLYNASIMITSYLSPHELDAVWDKLGSVPCAASLSAGEKNWIALFRAVGDRDAQAMVRLAKTLLENEMLMPQAAEKYLVAAGMAGSLMQGDKLGAHSLWTTYQSDIFDKTGPDLLFQMLVARSAVSD